MKKILLSVFSLAVVLSVSGQTLQTATTTVKTTKPVAPPHRTCGVLDHESWMEQNDPSRNAQRQAFEQQVQAWVASHQNQSSIQAAINIPIVVHVIYNNATQNISTNQVLSQVAVLNQDFTHTNPDIGSVPAPWTSIAANVDVNFCLAQQDPAGNASTGIDRVSTSVTSFTTDDAVKFTASGGANAWDPTRYFNIWVCNLGGGLLGYGEFPTGTVSQTYGLVVGYFCFGSSYAGYGTFPTLLTAYNRGRTSTHEIGHCFNLNHIWGDDGTGCGGTDNVADTPNQAGENYGCPAYPHTDACTAANPGVMFMNYMDYTDDACMYMFTNGQKTRMLAIINGPAYGTLQTSTACIPPALAPPVALFSASSTAVCPSTPITFTDMSTSNTTSWAWTFPSGSPASSTAQNPAAVTWSTPGTYTVTLVATNANGNSTYTMAVTVLGIVNPPLTEGFEATTYAPAGWTLYDAASNGVVWSRYNAGRNSSYSSKFDNYNNDVQGARDDVRTPRMNFASASTITLTFDVAHRRYSTVAGEQDSMQVMVSTNCGATWTQVYYKGGSTLATVTGVQTTAFTPTNTQWRNETVNLNAYAGQGGVIIAFRNCGHYGNNIYVDNVNIATTTSALPSATFTASTLSVCRGTAVSFTDNSTNSPTTWTWTFPSGTPASATTQNVASVVWNTAGTYTVTHTATNGSGTGTTTQTITVLATPTVTATASSNTICSGSTVTLTGGGATTYAWMPGSLSGSPVSVTPASTTTYTVTGTAANGCTSTGTRAITVNPSPTVNATATSVTICSGSSTTMTATGANTYNWMPGNINNASATVSPTTTTTYTVTGTTTATGCTGTRTIVITVNPTPTVTTTASTTTICSGNSTTLTANGATTYTWMPGSLSGSPVTVSPTTTTTYTVTGTSTGCNATATRVITVNPSPTVTATSGTTTLCSGNSTTLTGGGASTYSWLPGPLSGSPVTVTPGTSTTYTVTGTAANGCTGTATRAITVNPTPTVTTTASTTTICSGNSTTITATGATTYTWMPGSLSGSPVTVSPTTTTTYTVTGTSTGCTSTATRLITVNTSPTVTATSGTTTLCSGNSTTLSGGGASTYSWLPGPLSGSPVTVTPGTSTTYTVTGTAANGCTGTATRAITVNTSPTVTASASSTSICTGNNVTLTSSGASTYNWMPGSLSGTPVTTTPASTTTYTVTGTAGNGCTNSQTVLVTVGSQPTVSASTSSPSVCIGSSATLTGSGAATFAWMPGSLSGTSVTVSPTVTTTYTVTGTNGPGCSNTSTVVVTVNSLPTVGASTSSPSVCVGSSATLTGSGASTYAWMPGSLSGTTVSVAPSAPTTYTVTGTGANGCTNTSTVSVAVNALPSVSASASSPAICIGSSTTLTGAGASTYAWMPGSLSGTTVSVAPSAPTTYTITGTGANGCTNTSTVSVAVNALPSVSASASSPAICIGSSTTLTGAGASTYAWMPGSLSGTTVTDAPVSTTTYTVTGTDANGCSNTSTVAVAVNALPTVSASASSPAICTGSSTTLTGSGAATYDWMPGSLSGTTVTDAPVSTTTYTVTGTDANGCSNTSTVSVTVNALPTVSASASVPAICEGDIVTLTGSGATTYSWMPGSLSGTTVTDSPLSSVTYTVNGTDANGCSNTSTVSVTVNTLPTVSASSSASVTCAGGQITLTGNGASSYDWMPGSLSGSTVTDVPPSSTTYTVTGTDVNGCSNTGTLSVTVNTLPTVSVTLATDTFCDADGPTALAGGSPAGGNYSGPGVSGNAFDASALGAGTYTITYTFSDVNGCSDSASQSVVVDVCNGITSPEGTTPITVVPNPNNGNFALNFTINSSADYVLEIYNSIGQVVYSKQLNSFSGQFHEDISLEQFGRGMYTVRLRSADSESVIRVITQ